MPLTGKGDKIMSNMKKEYGSKKGKEVFYASQNKGTITGTHEKGAEVNQAYFAGFQAKCARAGVSHEVLLKQALERPGSYAAQAVGGPAANALMAPKGKKLQTLGAGTVGQAAGTAIGGGAGAGLAMLLQLLASKGRNAGAVVPYGVKALRPMSRLGAGILGGVGGAAAGNLVGGAEAAHAASQPDSLKDKLKALLGR